MARSELWFVTEVVGGRPQLEPFVEEALLLDETAADRLLTHHADREPASRALKRAREHGIGQAWSEATAELQAVG